MIKKLQYLFFPHHSNNHKAKALHLSSLTFLLVLIAAFQVGLSFLANIKPGVLGFAANINPNRLVDLTNQRRSDQGLGTLQINGLLSEAARRKASEMFTFGCWSHDCNGHSPWWFISGVGYSYIYAGENLAKDFDKTPNLIQAWMNSPTHRENIVNPNYTEIGFAVVNGKLDGEETTLVVQEFAKPEPGFITSTLEEPVGTLGINQVTVEETPTVNYLSSSSKSFVSVNILYIMYFSYFVLGFFAMSLLIDGVWAYKEGHLRVTGNTVSHIILFVASIVFIFYLHHPEII